MTNTLQPYNINDLLTLMSRLREPGSGCPWDLKQDFCSIAPSTLEEAYEVVDAIERSDFAHLPEELGDLLFQVVFYSQLGAEAGLFDFNQVVSIITAKLIRRHPHVFPEGTLDSRCSAEYQVKQNEEAIKASWEAIKRTERDKKGQLGLLDDVPVSMPAISRARKLQKRASSVGFDWSDVASVLAVVEGELAELKSALTQSEYQADVVKQNAIAEELGDLLFSIVNLSRHLRIDADSALRSSNRKFERRFGYIETQLVAMGKTVAEVDIEVLEEFWQEAKRNGL